MGSEELEKATELKFLGFFASVNDTMEIRLKDSHGVEVKVM